MKVVEVDVGEALAPSLLAGYDWALNPYRGCAFDCLYCYAPEVVRLDRASWADTIYVKRGAATALARELRRKRQILWHGFPVNQTASVRHSSDQR